jgi:hypothetical protein
MGIEVNLNPDDFKGNVNTIEQDVERVQRPHDRVKRNEEGGLGNPYLGYGRP